MAPTLAEQLQEAHDLQTVRDFIRFGASRLAEEAVFLGHGTDNPWDESVALVMHALFLPADGSKELLDARLTASEKTRVLKLLERRLGERMPLPYLTGIAHFCGLEFHVDKRVLIPRSPIGELIENQFAPWLPHEPERILDLCTGSGCIGIACAYAFDQAEVLLGDISSDALDVAEQNVVLHGLEGRAACVESDLFAGMPGETFDLIVSNPPYVDAEDFHSMPAEYQHEPEIALTSGNDGLDFTLRLLAEAPDHLNPQGVLVVEVGNSWVHLQDRFPEIPFTWLEFERGGHGVFLFTCEQLLKYRGLFQR